jgi:hypothetical protein
MMAAVITRLAGGKDGAQNIHATLSFIRRPTDLKSDHFLIGDLGEDFLYGNPTKNISPTHTNLKKHPHLTT